VVVASQKNGLPVGVFSVLFGSGREVGTALVDHPAIRAVGFTGSESVGRGLFDQASRRPIPIPVFAEMSSINPVLLLPGALASRAGAIAEGFYPSLTMGVGQFCTNPGLVLLDRSAGARQFVETLAQKLRSHPAEPMLNRGTRQSYYDGLRAIGDADGVEVLVEPADSPGPGSCHATPALLRVGAAAFARSSRLKHEVFGPATLLVECDNAVEMRTVLSSLGGQLTVTIHGEPDDFAAHADLMQTAELLAGRLVFNGFPTGVEVCASMVHGGPYPATTDARFTSVGARAIDRFLRPVCYQNAPAAVLPAELR
ncbi:MAG TPA: aldehyde dehydrogenase family protein, partial [Tepidisphaeraceae bacterium]|nr:aldehyde dehydrogenase family protein [Tepidisphaeraceae bacterium]